MITIITHRAIHPLLFVHAFCHSPYEKPQPLHSEAHLPHGEYLANENKAER